MQLFVRRGRGRGLDRGLDRGPDKGPDKGLDRGLDRGPDKGPNKGLDRGLDRRYLHIVHPVAQQLLKLLTQELRRTVQRRALCTPPGTGSQRREGSIGNRCANSDHGRGGGTYRRCTAGSWPTPVARPRQSRTLDRTGSDRD